MRHTKVAKGDDIEEFENAVAELEKQGYEAQSESFRVEVKDTFERGTTCMYFVMMKMVSPMDLHKRSQK